MVDQKRVDLSTKKFSSNRSAKRELKRLRCVYKYTDFRFKIENKKQIGRNDNTNEPKPRYC